MANQNMIKEPEKNGAEPTRNVQTYLPNVDILERADELLLMIDMPGADPKTIDIDFDAGALTINAKVASRQADDTQYLVQEFGVGDFHRAFRVSEDVDSEKISAEYNLGVLKLRLPKAEAVKPRKIDVAIS